MISASCPTCRHRVVEIDFAPVSPVVGLVQLFGLSQLPHVAKALVAGSTRRLFQPSGHFCDWLATSREDSTKNRHPKPGRNRGKWSDQAYRLIGYRTASKLCHLRTAISILNTSGAINTCEGDGINAHFAGSPELIRYSTHNCYFQLHFKSSAGREA